MRSLSKAKIVESWYAGRIPVMQIREDKKGVKHTCYMLEIPAVGIKNWIARDIKDMRMSELRKAALTIVDYHERGYIADSALESMLDFIYGELNRRLNKERNK